jgi:hypothetical protein
MTALSISMMLCASLRRSLPACDVRWLPPGTQGTYLRIAEECYVVSSCRSMLAPNVTPDDTYADCLACENAVWFHELRFCSDGAAAGIYVSRADYTSTGDGMGGGFKAVMKYLGQCYEVDTASAVKIEDMAEGAMVIGASDLTYDDCGACVCELCGACCHSGNATASISPKPVDAVFAEASNLLKGMETAWIAWSGTAALVPQPGSPPVFVGYSADFGVEEEEEVYNEETEETELVTVTNTYRLRVVVSCDAGQLTVNADKKTGSTYADAGEQLLGTHPVTDGRTCTSKPFGSFQYQHGPYSTTIATGGVVTISDPSPCCYDNGVCGVCP